MSMGRAIRMSRPNYAHIDKCRNAVVIEWHGIFREKWVPKWC